MISEETAVYLWVEKRPLLLFNCGGYKKAPENRSAKMTL